MDSVALTNRQGPDSRAAQTVRRPPTGDTGSMTPGIAAALHRLALSAEKAAVQGSFGTPAPAEFSARFVLAVIADLEANRVEPKAGVVPAYVHRAETYMGLNADRSIALTDIAQAAGCSVRALQYAFRRFRGTSPKAALRQVRLDRARAELSRGDSPVDSVARRFGFSNASRFTAAYFRRFGEAPSATRQRT